MTLLTEGLWIPKGWLNEMQAWADKAYPLETGGTLMGYHAEGEVVITAITGPGPKEVHAENAFVPDYEHQDAEIAKVYAASDRHHTYLGDWHTHPGGGAALSPRDKRTLRIISPHLPARVHTPIMGDPVRGHTMEADCVEVPPPALSIWRLMGRYTLVASGSDSN